MPFTAAWVTPCQSDPVPVWRAFQRGTSPRSFPRCPPIVCLGGQASHQSHARAMCVCLDTSAAAGRTKKKLMWLSSWGNNVPPPSGSFAQRLSHTSPSGRASFQTSITAGSPIFQPALGGMTLSETFGEKSPRSSVSALDFWETIELKSG